ncbi:MAG TPA: glycosyltransferase family 4 protein [Steroidobacteraceae bacterium]|nr:glycosyltransferase family 4 protein [Steroidobacteraceae bacterium]
MNGLALHVVQVGFYVDPLRREPAQLLQAWPTLVDVAEAARDGGIRVSVVQASARAQTLDQNGVQYHFFPREADAPALIGSLEPDVIHVHGLHFPREVLRLSARLPHVPILQQDHASRPPRFWRRPLYRRAFAATAGVAFCSRPQGWPFEEARLIDGATQIYALPESTSRFMPGAREEARARTGLQGNPCLLWVASLSPRKDPLTVLEGVSRAVDALPGLELWCCYGEAPLEKAVTRRIEEDVRLRGRVHLLGRRPHEQIESLMQAADVFVLGSHFEGSGYALIEALACGLPPLVTDIPPFRALTGDGTIGRLWWRGDPQSLADELLGIASEVGPARRAAVRAHFEHELSLPALGRQLEACYVSLLGRRGARQ